jgi:hypothetical protein
MIEHTGVKVAAGAPDETGSSVERRSRRGGWPS